MGGHVEKRPIGIAASCDDIAAPDDDRADRNLALRCGQPRILECQFHETLLCRHEEPLNPDGAGNETPADCHIWLNPIGASC